MRLVEDPRDLELAGPELLLRRRDARGHPFVPRGAHLRTQPDVVRDRAIEEERADDRREGERLPDVGLDEQVVVDDAADQHGVRQAVQQLPALGAEPHHHAVGRRQRERDHQHERAEPEPQVDALDDLGERARDAAASRSNQKKIREVRREVEEAEHAEVAAHRDQRVPAGQLAQRRDRRARA